MKSNYLINRKKSELVYIDILLPLRKKGYLAYLPVFWTTDGRVILSGGIKVGKNRSFYWLNKIGKFYL